MHKRISHTLRLSCLLAVSLGLGAVLSLGTAVFAVCQWQTFRSRGVLENSGAQRVWNRHYGVTPTTGFYGFVDNYSAWSITAIISDSELKDCLAGEKAAAHSMLVIEAGFPFTCMNAEQIKVPGRAPITRGWNTHTTMWPLSDPFVLPCQIVWVGLVANSAAYGIVIAIAVVVVVCSRPIWRTLRHCCPVCGYDLRGTRDVGGCPECGWRRTA